jgi:cell wall-associated NlpC family hydrolase
MASGLAIAMVALTWAVLALVGCGQGGATSKLAGASTPEDNPVPQIHPSRPPHEDELVPRTRPRSPEPKSPGGGAATAAESAPPASAGTNGSTHIPPASAGTNGSFTPPPSGHSKPITPRTLAALGPQAANERAVLLDGIALAPPGAPEAIKGAISAANTIVGRPYVWGGGHDSWYSVGYDCSGAVSFALGGGGLLASPLTSTQLESWGAPGPGRWLTVYANGGHAYAVIAGLRWDTVGDARGTGPRWHPLLPYPDGFEARHLPGY